MEENSHNHKNMFDYNIYIEWGLLIIFTGIGLSIALFFKEYFSRRVFLGLGFLIIGLIHIFCSNVLSEKYNYRFPKILYLLRPTPFRVRIMGVISLIVSLYEFISR